MPATKSPVRRATRTTAVLAALAVTVVFVPGLVMAQSVIDEWSSATFPPPPKLKPAKADAKKTVLLIMDMTHQTCTEKRRPRCVAAIPKVKKLLALAREKGAMVMFSVAGGKAKDAKDVVKELAPRDNETVLPSLGPDKFIHSKLEQTLKDKGITTIIALGTQAQTSVLHTAGEAALRGFNVIVPVDGATSDAVFPELYTVWHLSTAARIAPKVTLTRTDMISF